MKITIQDQDINEIATKVSAYAVGVVTQVVWRREDEALIEEIRASGATNRDKVVAYLERTKLNVGRIGDRSAVRIAHAELSKATGLSTYAIRGVICELSRVGRMSEMRITNRLTLTYVRRQPQVAPQPAPTH